MNDEPLSTPNGKEFYLVPINPNYPNWLENAHATLTSVSRRTAGKLQMRGVGMNKAGDQDPHCLLAIKGSVLGQTMFLFSSLYWLKPDKRVEGVEMAMPIFEGFLNFTRNVAGGAGLVVGDPVMIEVIAAIAENSWPPKEPDGCALIQIKISAHDKPTSVSRTLDPSADPQRRLALVF